MATLGRGDGLLVFLVVAMAAVRIEAFTERPHHGLGRGALAGLLMVAGFLVVMAPWYGRNLIVFDWPFPPAASKVVFLEEYEDIYSYGKPLTLAHFVERLQADPWEFVEVRIRGLWKATRNALRQSAPLLPFVALALPAARRRRETALIGLAVLHVALCIAFYGVVAPLLGDPAIHKASMVSFPLLAGAAACGLTSLRNHRLKLVFGAAWIAGLVVAAEPALSTVERRKNEYEWIREAALGQSANPTAAVMSRKPWQIYEATGLPALQIPKSDIDTIYSVAQRFGATHLTSKEKGQAPIPATNSPRRCEGRALRTH